MHRIPFNRPYITGKELGYITQTIQDACLSGDGPFTKKCNEWMEKNFGAKKVLLTHSCTAALEMSAILCNIRPGDEVIMPSFTFVSTANAFLLQGAAIRFIDIRPDTLNIDEILIEKELTAKTKAIIPMHYAGISCEMDAIMEIAQRFNLIVVEDAAQGVNATYKRKYLGTIGHLGAYSFHETKNIISGEGGALVINDDRFLERGEIIREKGTNRARFLRGEVDKYTWVDIGSSYLPSELISAFLFAQLQETEKITHKRMEVFDYYMQELTLLQDREMIRLPSCPPECTHNAHLFYILILTAIEDRNKLIDHLKSKNIQSVFHYVPLHSSPMGANMGYKKGDLKITEEMSDRLIRLPLYFDLPRSDQDRVIDEIFHFFNMSR